MTNEKVLPNISYKLTIGNLSSVVALIMAIYYYVNPGAEGWGIYIAILLVMFGLLMFAFDFIIQTFGMKYIVLNLIEIVILIIVICLLKT
jgi:hypothetical protein